MLQAILIRWALDKVMDLVIEIATEQVAERKSPITRPFLKTLINEKDTIKKEILKKIGK